MSKKSKLLSDAIMMGLIAFLLFGPITGLILDGFSYEVHWQRPLYLSLITAAGRFLFLLFAHSDWGGYWWQRFYSRRDAPTVVEKADKKLNTKLLLSLVIIALITPFFLSKYLLTVFILAMIYVLLALGLNIVVGLAGLLDLGFVAFYAVGAYGYALGAQYLDLGFWSALPFAAIMAATFGAILGFPVLKMHGDYLAIVTLGFGEIIRLVLNNWTSFTGGPNGVRAPAPTLLNFEFTRIPHHDGILFHEYFNLPYSNAYRYIYIYIVLFLLVCLMLAFVYRLKKMPLGRAWEALREDEIACRSLGINHVSTKLSAFSLGAMVGGLGGVFFAASHGFINPSSFTFIESALILAIVVLGGMGSILGVVIAAIVLTLLPELLREFADFRMLSFGAIMVIMMIIRPRGLVRIKRDYFKIYEQ